jgi:hypothetical protein
MTSRTSPFLLATIAAILGAVGCAAGRRPSATTPVPPTEAVLHPEVGPSALDLVGALPENASAETLIGSLPSLISAMQVARGPGVRAVRQSIEVLRQQPNTVRAFENVYAQVPTNNWSRRRFLIAVVGELRRPDGLGLLQSVVWGTLPQPTRSKSLSAREMEESVQAKAVEGMAYLRSDEGDKAVLRVIDSHPSSVVRAAAIDSYLWNHGDTKQALDEMCSRVRVEDRKYVGLARFSRKMKADIFNRQLAQSRDRCQ